MTERAKVIPIRPLREILKRKLVEKRTAEFMEHLEKKGIHPKPVKKTAHKKVVRAPVQLELFP